VILFALGAPIVFSGMVLSLSQMQNDVTQWLPAEYPETREFVRFLQHFDPEAFVLVSWEGCTLDDPRVAQLAEGLVGAPSIEPGATRSPYYSKVITGPSMLETLTSTPINLTREQAIQRLRGSLIGLDGRTTCAVFSMTPEGVAHMRPAIDALYEVAKRDCGLTQAQLKLGGPPVDNVALDVAGEQSMLRVLGLTSVCGLLVCWWCLRHPLLIAVVLIAGFYTVAASLSVFYFTGGVMNAIVLTMPPLVYVAGVSGAIHLANYYREALPEHGVIDAPWQAVRQATLPLLLATFTTAVGLLSLAASELAPIRTLGIFSAIGVFIGLGCILLWVPAVLELWPVVERPRQTSAIHRRGLDGSQLTRLGAAYPKLVTVCVLVLLGSVAWGATRLVSSVQIMRLFSPDAKIISDYAWLEERLGPLAPIDVVVHFAPNCALDLRQRIELVEDLQGRVNELEHVGSSLSAATFAPDLRAIARPQSSTASIFNRKRMRQTVQKVRLERHRADFVRSGFLRDADGGELWRVTARVAALADVDYHAFTQSLDAAVQPLVRGLQKRGFDGVSVTYTGALPIVYQAQNSLLRGMLIGYGSDVALLAVAMVVVMNSLSAGLILLAASVLPALAVFGAMGWLGIVVDMGAVMPPSVALGVTVDDVMHFLLRYRDGVRAGQSRRDAVLEAYHHCGRPMYQSWAILGLGILAFAFSPFLPTRRFGYVMVALLTVGLIGNLLFLPALLCGPLGRLWQRSLLKRSETRRAEQEQAEPAPAVSTVAAVR
jgi:predicted RND superfamily exporter protein